MPKVSISQHLVKDYWKRRVIGERIKHPSVNPNVKYKDLVGEDAVNYRLLTQDDFLNEINPEAHEINSGMYSRRPIYDVVEETDKNGKKKKKWVLKGYDDCEVVSLPLQYRFAMSKASFFAADGFWTSNETTDHERYKIFESWKDIVGLKTAYLEAVISCFMTGDAAIYLYQRGNTLEYTVFSYLKGDVLYPDIDENRNPIVYRQYTLKGRRAVDVYATDRIETWVQGNIKDESDVNGNWIDKIKGWFKSFTSNGEKSEDGYTLISRNKTQLGKDVNQCVYFRINDIPSGCVQGGIESLERSLSYIAEEVKSSAFPVLMLKATKMESLPPMSAHGKTLGIKGSPEDLKYGEAKYLQKQDMSNIATLNIQKITDSIMHGSMSVFIDPEVIKQGSDSSTTMRLLFYPEEQWCQSMWPQFFHQVRQLVNVFKELVGKIEGDVIGYSKLRVSVGQNIFLPQNESERINNEIAQANARIKSKKAAMEDIGNAHIDDEKHIWEEWERELEIKARIPAEEKAKVEQEYGAPQEEIDVVETDDTSGEKKRIDNRMAGQSVYR